jgi:hypothetical protein
MKKIFFLFLILGTFVSVTSAQDEYSAAAKKLLAAVRNVPLDGNKAEDFVPGGWEISSEIAKGDLNGDGLADYALDLSATLENEGEFLNAVMILLSEKNGKLRRFAVNDRLSSGFYNAGFVVTIEKGSLILNSNYGENHATDLTYRFKYDPASADLLLTSFEYETYTRSGSQNALLTKYHFLTGLKEEITKVLNRRKSSTALYSHFKTKRTKFKSARVPFRDAHFQINENIGVSAK